MKYSLVSREVIADSIETAVTRQSMDGVLAIGGSVGYNRSTVTNLIQLRYGAIRKQADTQESGVSCL